MKWKTFGKVAETIARVAVPHADEVLDAAHAIHDRHGDDRAAAIMTEIDASLVAAGDLAGKAVLADVEVRTLARKYAEDGLALHALIERKKKALATTPATAAELGVLGATGD